MFLISRKETKIKIRTFASRTPSTAFKAKQILIVSVASQQSQRPSDRILVLLMQDQLGGGHLDLAQADLFAVIVNIDYFEQFVVRRENAAIVDSFEDAL